LAYPSIIAIDGPASSGKSTMGKMLAEHLGYLYFDTGVMYRAVTWVAINQGIDLTIESKLNHLAETVQIDVRPPSKNDGRSYDVLVDDLDVTWEIREPIVEENVSLVSAYPQVRQALGRQQRRIGSRGKVVMVGRDIGTVILPEADLKIYLDASVEERALRRYLERKAREEPVDYQDILPAMRNRDLIDSTRKVAPLKPASDAHIIITDGLTINQVFDKILLIMENQDD
jgi:cytidylate kinase